MADQTTQQNAAFAGAATGAASGAAAGPVGALLGGIVGGASSGGFLNCIFGCPKPFTPPTPWYEKPVNIALLVGGSFVFLLGVVVYKKRH